MSGDAIRSIGYGNYMSDPYFLAALNSYNPSFKSSYVAEPDNTRVASYPDTSVNLPSTESQVTSAVLAAQGEESDSTGLLVGGALTLLTAGACYAAHKSGNGKGMIQGFKNIWKSITGKNAITKPMTAFTLKAKDGSVIKIEGGKVKSIQAAGEPTVIKKAKEVKKYLADNGIRIPSYYKRVSGGTELAEGFALERYGLTIGSNKYIVEDGNIVLIKSGKKTISGTEEVEEFLEKLGSRKDGILKRIDNIESGTSKEIGKLTDVRYRYNKDNLTYTNWTYSGSERLEIQTALKDLNETEQKAWLHRNGDINTTIQELLTNGRADNVKRNAYWFTDASKNRYYINDKGEIETIILKKVPKDGSRRIAKGTTEFDAYLYDNEEIINAIKADFESGLAPDGIKTNFIMY